MLDLRVTAPTPTGFKLLCRHERKVQEVRMVPCVLVPMPPFSRPGPAAASMGMTPELILGALSKLSKNPLDEGVAGYVRACTSGYGKVKLVLTRGKYNVESAYPSLIT